MQRFVQWGVLVCAVRCWPPVPAVIASSSGSRFDSGLEIKVLSNRADLVSGGDALSKS